MNLTNFGYVEGRTVLKIAPMMARHKSGNSLHHLMSARALTTHHHTCPTEHYASAGFFFNGDLTPTSFIILMHTF